MRDALLHRKAFALAGGFDVGWWPVLAVQAGLFGVYWWTSTLASDPIEIIREPWYFVAISTVVGFGLTRLAAEIVFRRPPGVLRRLHMPVKVSTSERLELAHRTMPFMLTVGVVSLGSAVWTYRGGPDWKGWVAIGITGSVGVLMTLMACNSYILLDKTRGRYEATHRYLFKKSTSSTPLSSIKAIAINSDKMLGSVLSVICTRVGDKKVPPGKDLPMTMFGTAFGAAIYHDAHRIGRFLDVPVFWRERLVLKGPEDHVEDFLGGRISKTVFDPLYEAADAIRSEPQGVLALRCTRCGVTEEFPVDELFDNSSRRNFHVDVDSSGNVEVGCRNCYATATEIAASIR